MANGDWEIKEIQLIGTDLILRVNGQNNLHPQAGQYVHAFAVGGSETTATSLFFADVSGGGWGLTGKIPPTWSPGMVLRWHGPLGRGFNMLPAYRRILLFPWQNSGLVLLPLVRKALDQSAEVVWCGGNGLPIFPESVEVLPIEMLREVLAWADYTAIECDIDQLGRLKKLNGLTLEEHISDQVEVLVRTLMPCTGQGECMVCAVKTHRGWKTACKDGPVFSLNQLELLL